MTDRTTCPAVERKPGKASGAWAFAGMRVPLFALYENLAAGATVGEFVEWFPGVDEEQVRAVLEHEAQALRTDLARWRCCSSGDARPAAEPLPGAFCGNAGGEGWSEKDNGELLDLAERKGYEVLATTDRSMRHQQNIAGR